MSYSLGECGDIAMTRSNQHQFYANEFYIYKRHSMRSKLLYYLGTINYNSHIWTSLIIQVPSPVAHLFPSSVSLPYPQ